MRFKSILTLLGIILFTVSVFLSCQSVTQSGETDEANSTDRVSAFRVRSDFDMDLDEDLGWATDINMAPSQIVDSPFRIRFEVETDESVYRRQYSLQYRWNDGSWIYIDAHEFPYESSASPTVSIVGCDAFYYGEEADDLMAVSKMPANPGAGIQLAPTTPGWFPVPESGASAEWEFALVIRRWADGPQLVKDGDRFSLRMVDHLGRPLSGSHAGIFGECTQGSSGGNLRRNTCPDWTL
jgi:hypothetical protein